MEKSTNARILAFDIEITPILGYTYSMWKTNVMEVVRYPYIMCVSYKWVGEKGTTQVITLTDFPDEMAIEHELAEALLVRQVWELLDDADIVLAHNVKFDTKWMNTKFIEQGMTEPSPYRVIDTLAVARTKTRFPSKSLDNLCRRLEIGTKTRVRHGSLWLRCINGDMAAWRMMNKYVKRDTDLLVKLYLRTLPFYHNHPAITTEYGVCTTCGGRLVKNGIYWNRARTLAYQQYLCTKNGHWKRDSKSIKSEDRATTTNAL